MAQTRDGENPYQIAVGSRTLASFILDPQRSLVYYPASGRYDGALVYFDLETRLYHAVAVPFSEGMKMLDVRRERDTTLATYTVSSPCAPEALANGEDPWILPGKPLPATQAPSVCLATIPSGRSNR